MADDAIKAILISNRWLFTENSFFVSIFRWLAWMVTRGCIALAKAGLTIYNKAFGMVDFTQYPEVEQFITSFRPVVIAVICCSLFALGITLIIKRDRMPDILTRICLVTLILTSSTYIFSLMNEALISGKEAIVGSSTETVVSQVITSNLYDILYIDQETGLGNLTGNRSDYPEYPSITDDEIELLDINAVLNYNTSEDITSEGKDILKHKVDFRKDGDHKLKEVYNGFGWNSSDDDDWFNGFYYRYKVDWVTLLMTLVSICLVYILLAYKVFRILVELVLHRLLAVFTSANLTSSQKALKVLDSIKNSYIVALITCVMIRLYLLGSTYISGMEGMSGFVKGIFLLFLAFTIIDGPNLVQQLFGIDAGLRSTLGSMMAMVHAGKGVADKVVDTTGNVVGGMVNAGGKIFGGGVLPGGMQLFGGSSGITGMASADAGNMPGGIPDPTGMDDFDDMTNSINDALNGGFEDAYPEPEEEQRPSGFEDNPPSPDENMSPEFTSFHKPDEQTSGLGNEPSGEPGQDPSANEALQHGDSQMPADASNMEEEQMSAGIPNMEDADNSDNADPLGNIDNPENFDDGRESLQNGEVSDNQIKIPEAESVNGSDSLDRKHPSDRPSRDPLYGGQSALDGSKKELSFDQGDLNKPDRKTDSQNAGLFQKELNTGPEKGLQDKDEWI